MVSTSNVFSINNTHICLKNKIFGEDNVRKLKHISSFLYMLNSKIPKETCCMQWFIYFQTRTFLSSSTCFLCLYF